MINYQQLEALHAVISEAGFEKAAAKLFITQSAVSRRIGAQPTALSHCCRAASAKPLTAGNAVRSRPGDQCVKRAL